MKSIDSPGYSIRGYEPEDEEQVLDLLSQGLQGWAAYSDKRALWRWKHFANPFGPSHVLVACNEGGNIIGALVFMHWQFRFGSQIIQSVRVTDSATLPAYRGLGIATTLRQRLVERAQHEGALLMFGTPNQYALPVSLKVGGQPIGKIRLLLRVLNYRHFVTGLVRSRLREHHSPHDQAQHFFREEPLTVESLLERRGQLTRLLEQDQQFQNKSYRTHRSLEYLQWRYGEHPLISYYTLFREHRGELLGGLIFRTDTYHSLKGIVLNELLLGRADEHLASTILNQLMSTLDADYILTYFSKDSLHRRILGKRGFLRLPLRAYHLTIGVWGPGVGEESRNLDNWGLTPGELEEAWAWR
jgi:GNAT superfamily N-acetyltransferase